MVKPTMVFEFTWATSWIRASCLRGSVYLAVFLAHVKIMAMSAYLALTGALSALSPTLLKSSIVVIGQES